MELVAEQQAPGVAIVHVGGEIDMLTAPSLQRTVDDQLKSRPVVLVIDMREVTFFGVSGVAVLMETRAATAHSATSVRVVCAARAVTRVLGLLGFSDMFEMYSDLEGALEPSC